VASARRPCSHLRTEIATTLNPCLASRIFEESRASHTESLPSALIHDLVTSSGVHSESGRGVSLLNAGSRSVCFDSRGFPARLSNPVIFPNTSRCINMHFAVDARPRNIYRVYTHVVNIVYVHSRFIHGLDG